MLTRQSMIALAVAIILGIAAVYIANVYIGGSKQQAELQGTTKVAVAAFPLAFGTELTPDKVRFVDYPRTSVPPGAFADGTQLLPAGQKRFALMPISINEPILADKISAPGAGASIAALLPDGMRAATVRIDDVSGVAGFVQPNDTVDVLITRQVDRGGGGQQVTDVLLQNIRVLAIDQQAKNPDGTPKVGRTATFEVAPIDAQKLALAQQSGSLSLVLRKPGEQNNPVVETVSLNDLRYNMYGGARYPAPAVVGGLGGAIVGAMDRATDTINSTGGSRPRSSRTVSHASGAKRAPAPAPEKPSIEIYRGTTSNSYKVGG
jgi:pilus assembly protein CpaB